jgi:hypothetical protein
MDILVKNVHLSSIKTEQLNTKKFSLIIHILNLFFKITSLIAINFKITKNLYDY